MWAEQEFRWPRLTLHPTLAMVMPHIWSTSDARLFLPQTGLIFCQKWNAFSSICELFHCSDLNDQNLGHATSSIPTVWNWNALKYFHITSVSIFFPKRSTFCMWMSSPEKHWYVMSSAWQAIDFLQFLSSSYPVLVNNFCMCSLNFGTA